MQPRNYSVDLLRIIASFGVVWLHVSSSVVIVQPDPNSFTWWVGNFADSMSRWSVPIFVMISGSLLLPQSFEISYVEFFKKRVARFFLPLIFWTSLFSILRIVFVKDTNFVSILKLIMRGEPYYHLWYLYMIIGLYLVTPFLARFISNAPRRLIFWAIVVSFLMESFSNFLATIQHIPRRSFLDLWPLFVGYFLAGFYLRELRTTDKAKRYLLAGIIFSGIAIAVTTGFLFPVYGNMAWDIMYSYLNPFVIGMTLCIFVLAQNSQPEQILSKYFSPKTIQNIAQLTFGIYLFHPLWLGMLSYFDFEKYYVAYSLIGIPVVSIVVYFLSLLAVWLMSQIPYLRNTVR